jgi:hypothetical protein
VESKAESKGVQSGVQRSPKRSRPVAPAMAVGDPLCQAGNVATIGTAERATRDGKLGTS